MFKAAIKTTITIQDCCSKISSYQAKLAENNIIANVEFEKSNNKLQFRNDANQFREVAESNFKNKEYILSAHLYGLSFREYEKCYYEEDAYEEKIALKNILVQVKFNQLKAWCCAKQYNNARAELDEIIHNPWYVNSIYKLYNFLGLVYLTKTSEFYRTGAKRCFDISLDLFPNQPFIQLINFYLQAKYREFVDKFYPSISSCSVDEAKIMALMSSELFDFYATSFEQLLSTASNNELRDRYIKKAIGAYLCEAELIIAERAHLFQQVEKIKFIRQKIHDLVAQQNSITKKKSSNDFYFLSINREKNKDWEQVQIGQLDKLDEVVFFLIMPPTPNEINVNKINQRPNSNLLINAYKTVEVLLPIDKAQFTLPQAIKLEKAIATIMSTPQEGYNIRLILTDNDILLDDGHKITLDDKNRSGLAELFKTSPMLINQNGILFLYGTILDKNNNKKQIFTNLSSLAKSKNINISSINELFKKKIVKTSGYEELKFYWIALVGFYWCLSFLITGTIFAPINLLLTFAFSFLTVLIFKPLITPKEFQEKMVEAKDIDKGVYDVIAASHAHDSVIQCKQQIQNNLNVFSGNHNFYSNMLLRLNDAELLTIYAQKRIAYLLSICPVRLDANLITIVNRCLKLQNQQQEELRQQIKQLSQRLLTETWQPQGVRWMENYGTKEQCAEYRSKWRDACLRYPAFKMQYADTEYYASHSINASRSYDYLDDERFKRQQHMFFQERREAEIRSILAELNTDEFDFSNITNEEQQHYLDNLKKRSYKGLSLSNCSMLTDQILLELITNSIELEYLDISNCQKITDTGIRDVFKHAHHLTSVKLDGLDKLTSLDFTPGFFEKAKSTGVNFLVEQGCAQLPSVTSYLKPFYWMGEIAMMPMSFFIQDVANIAKKAYRKFLQQNQNKGEFCFGELDKLIISNCKNLDNIKLDKANNLRVLKAENCEKLTELVVDSCKLEQLAPLNKVYAGAKLAARLVQFEESKILDLSNLDFVNTISPAMFFYILKHYTDAKKINLKGATLPAEEWYYPDDLRLEDGEEYRSSFNVILKHIETNLHLREIVFPNIWEKLYNIDIKRLCSIICAGINPKLQTVIFDGMGQNSAWSQIKKWNDGGGGGSCITRAVIKLNKLNRTYDCRFFNGYVSGLFGGASKLNADKGLNGCCRAQVIDNNLPQEPEDPRQQAVDKYRAQNLVSLLLNDPWLCELVLQRYQQTKKVYDELDRVESKFYQPSLANNPNNVFNSFNNINNNVLNNINMPRQDTYSSSPPQQLSQ